ncbi:glycosyltransferase family 4 protein [Candidatus Micrarchaeota archaeon]|nr:glycosyltransferase family 4 protein [Candidatus Micrarchaeota archaeon]
MKIAMVCPFFLPVVGGMENHVYQLSLELQKLGHEITVFTSKISHDGAQLAKSAQTINGIAVRRFKPLFRIGKFASFWPQVLKELNGFDIIHVHNLRHPHTEFGLWKGKTSKTPVVLTAHSPHHEGGRGKILEMIVKGYDAMQGIYPLPYFDKIIALHSQEKQWFLQKGVLDEKICIIPNGIDDEFFKAKKTGKEKDQIIFVGRIAKAKGLDLLLYTMKAIPGWMGKLAVVGPDGGEEKAMKNLAVDLGLGKRVLFFGKIPRRELISQLDASKAYVMPSKYEPFGISLLEAMSRGIACIAIESDGPRAIIQSGKTGILVENDAKLLAIEIEKVLKSEALRKKLGKNAMQEAKKYSWKGIAKKVEQEYLKLVQNK